MISELPQAGTTRLRFWSAETCHRFYGLADLSARQRRVQRRSNKLRLPTSMATSRLRKSGDKSPHSKA